ncbi:kinase-like domain-containing protein [Trichoderma novae-zelandiae]
MSGEKTKQEIEDAVRRELNGTGYAVSSLEPLTGGTANFIYRARLQKPLPDGSTEVVLKHGEAYVAQHPDFKLQMEIEEEGLRLLSHLPPVVSSRFEIRTPKLHHFSPESSTQIQEYLHNAVNLKDYALRHFQAPTLNDQPERQNLHELFAKNTEMRNIKKYINYDQLLARVNMFPSLLEECKDVLQQIVSMATAELADKGKLAAVHGDFWTGNVLLPDTAFDNARQVSVRVIDWEMAQVGVRAEDLGQFVAELWQLKLYKDINAALWIIRGFAEGYGKADADFTYRVLIHVGAHMICFGSTTPGWGTPEQCQKLSGLVETF